MYILNAFYLLHPCNPIFLICLCFNMVYLRGQKSLGHAQIGLLQRFNSKFPTSIPTPFICGVPLPGSFVVSSITPYSFLLSSSMCNTATRFKCFFLLDNLYLYYRKHESHQNPERTGRPNSSYLPIGSFGKDLSSVAALEIHIL